MKDLLRHIRLTAGDNAYELKTYDIGKTDSMGKYMVGYELAGPNGLLFEGEDFACSPMHAIDSDESVAGLLGFLTLRPGDTDADYFAEYTPEQMAFARGDAEQLQCDLACFEDDRNRDNESTPPWEDLAMKTKLSENYVPHVETVITELTYVLGQAKRMNLPDDSWPLEVRLQVNGQEWRIWDGAPDYDTDHRGHWGASSLDADMGPAELRSVAEDLISQVEDSIATDV